MVHKGSKLNYLSAIHRNSFNLFINEKIENLFKKNTNIIVLKYFLMIICVFVYNN
uniref:Uncharacterized protein n=1 Tax=Amorphochlora amoebiformis TaxID=1561963 RepID=A0A0H5BIT7_9EUKA|nr:hypothetical protein [Amorphochlora amoebiformis]